MRARRRAARAPLGSARPVAQNDTSTKDVQEFTPRAGPRLRSTQFITTRSRTWRRVAGLNVIIPSPHKNQEKHTKLSGAVQEPVRPDARETYPMGQRRTWRPLDAAAQSNRQVPIGIIRTEIPLHLRRPHGVRHEVVQDDEHVERIRVRSRSQPALEVLDVRPFSP